MANYPQSPLLKPKTDDTYVVHVIYAIHCLNIQVKHRVKLAIIDKKLA